jgi:5-methylcytosine-specific restriction endonuclease McrA
MAGDNNPNSFYRMCYILLTEEGEKRVLLYTKGDERGWPEHLKHYIISNAECAYCGKSIYKNLHYCRCGGDGRYHLNNWNQDIDKEWERSRQKSKSNIRKQREKSAGAKYTKEDILKLQKIQNDCCYYCGRESRKLSVDHLVPISRNGKNSLDNIALACLSCNSAKCSLTESEFWAILAKRHPRKWIRERQKQAKIIKLSVRQR